MKTDGQRQHRYPSNRRSSVRALGRSGVVAVVLFSLLQASPAWTQQPPELTPDQKRLKELADKPRKFSPSLTPSTVPAPEWTAGNWVLAPLVGAGGMLGGGLIGVVGGFVLGVLVSDRPGEDDCGIGLCLSDTVNFTVLAGGIAGLILGGTLSVYFYGRSRGFKGSFWWTLGGATLATLGLFIDSGAIMGLLLPLTATAGYALSLPESAPRQVARSLVHIDAEEGVELGMPSVLVTPSFEDPEGINVFVPLVSGSF